jgi:hypothetical protein
LDRGSEDRSRKALAKLAVVVVPLVLWLIAWSLWALWGIFVALLVIVLGRSPRGIWTGIAAFLQYVLRVTAYFSLTVEPFPGYRNLGHDDYPVSLALEYPERLARWLALARIVLSPLLARLPADAHRRVAVPVLARPPAERGRWNTLTPRTCSPAARARLAAAR